MATFVMCRNLGPRASKHYSRAKNQKNARKPTGPLRSVFCERGEATQPADECRGPAGSRYDGGGDNTIVWCRALPRTPPCRPKAVIPQAPADVRCEHQAPTLPHIEGRSAAFAEWPFLFCANPKHENTKEGKHEITFFGVSFFRAFVFAFFAGHVD